MRIFYIFIIIFLIVPVSLTFANEYKTFEDLDQSIISINSTNNLTINEIVDIINKQIGNHVLIGRPIYESTIEISFNINNSPIRDALYKLMDAYNKKVMLLNSLENKIKHYKICFHGELVKEKYCYIIGPSHEIFQGPLPKYLKLKYLSCDSMEAILLQKFPNILFATDKKNNAIIFPPYFQAIPLLPLINSYDVQLIDSKENLLYEKYH